jgi:hypothetical protein
MTIINGGQPTGLFFVFGYRGQRMDDGPYFVRSASSRREAEEHAVAILADRRWTRTVADDVRTNARVFDSAAPPDGPRLRHLTRPELA